jgi:hypothetical protein
MNEFFDKNKYYLKEIRKEVAKDMIVKHHYSHSWTSCDFTLGVFEKTETVHNFFDIVEDKVIGCIVYGHPIGRQVINGLVKPNDKIKLGNDNVLELTRLWIEDNHGKNIESWTISQSFEWLKKNRPEIKALISYADPFENHLGTIYQATNWLYQCIDNTSDDHHYMISTTEPPNCKWMHPRTLVSKYGTQSFDHLDSVLPRPYWKKAYRRKYRYVYVLTNKKEKRWLVDNLNPTPLPYPKEISNPEKNVIIRVD